MRLASCWVRQKIRLAMYNPVFMKWVGQRRFRHPETGNRVLFVSLPEDEQKRIYENWARMTEGEDAEKTEQENRELATNTDPDRYKHIEVDFNIHEEYRDRVFTLLGVKSEEEAVQAALDLAGGGGVASLMTHVELTFDYDQTSSAVDIAGWGDGLDFDRALLWDGNGKPEHIENGDFSVKPSAPEGVGTRMLVSQVAAAKKAGFNHIQTTAVRDAPFLMRFPSASMNGYYTWPRLGFNAKLMGGDLGRMESDIPEAVKEVRELAKKDPHRAFGEDVELYHIMAVPEARSWWEKYGQTIHATFFLDEEKDGGKGYDVLRQYAAAKAMTQGQTIPEYVKTGSKKKKMGPRFTAEDDKILDWVWSNVKKKLNQS